MFSTQLSRLLDIRQTDVEKVAYMYICKHVFAWCFGNKKIEKYVCVNCMFKSCKLCYETLFVSISIFKRASGVVYCKSLYICERLYFANTRGVIVYAKVYHLILSEIV